MLKPEAFFETAAFTHKQLFAEMEFVWEALSQLKNYIQQSIKPNIGSLGGDTLNKTSVLWNGEILQEGFRIESRDATKGDLKVYKENKELIGASIVCSGAALLDSDIQIGRGSIVEPGALIKGPTIIGDNTEVRQGAYLRGNCLVGDRCVVGHATEVKTSIMLNGSKAGHFAYIGDSILGNDVNLGAGTKLANLKIIKVDMTLRIEGKLFRTGLRKLLWRRYWICQGLRLSRSLSPVGRHAGRGRTDRWRVHGIRRCRIHIPPCWRTASRCSVPGYRNG